VAKIERLLDTDHHAGVLAAADLREQRAAAATQGRWVAATGRGKKHGVVGVPGPEPGSGVAVAVCGSPGTVKAANAQHIAAEANPATVRAAVALWRGIAQRHRWVDYPNGDAGDYTTCCTGCNHMPSDPDTDLCPDMRDVVAAARAYLTGLSTAPEPGGAA
jgi:hypothetical protein